MVSAVVNVASVFIEDDDASAAGFGFIERRRPAAAAASTAGRPFTSIVERTSQVPRGFASRCRALNRTPTRSSPHLTSLAATHLSMSSSTRATLNFKRPLKCCSASAVSD